VTVSVEPHEGVMVWLEELISEVEQHASCPVYSVLKRSDEKWVTERAFEKPQFVEDVVRDVVLALGGYEGIRVFATECVSVESIHNHDAAASVGWISPGELGLKRRNDEHRSESLLKAIP
jgi:GTP cyclohydrolase I